MMATLLSNRIFSFFVIIVIIFAFSLLLLLFFFLVIIPVVTLGRSLLLLHTHTHPLAKKDSLTLPSPTPSHTTTHCHTWRVCHVQRLAAYLFCDILAEAGIPRGVVNVVCGANDMATHLVNNNDIQKIAFTGSTDVGACKRE